MDAGGDHEGQSAAGGRSFDRPALRWLVLVTLVVLVVFALGWLYKVVLTIFAGVLLAVFLHGLADAVARHTRRAYGEVLGSLVVILTALAALWVWLVGPPLAGQIEQLATRIPAALLLVRRSASHAPMLGSLLKSTPDHVEPLIGAAANALRVGLEGVAAMLIAVVIGIYAAFDPGAYVGNLIRLVPQPRRGRARQAIERVTSTLMRWMVGRILAMVSVGVMTSLGLWIAGVPLPFALGLLAGVLTFIPYLGVLLSIIPALLLALTKSPWAVLWVVIVFGIAHGLEGYVLSPLIAKRTVRFPPAFTIAVQVLLGPVWGVQGFALATPIGVVATVLISMFYVEDTLGDRPQA